LLKGKASAVPEDSHPASEYRSAEGWSEGVAKATDSLPLFFVRNPLQFPNGTDSLQSLLLKNPPN
jgi:hypothetical protein